MKRKPAIAKQFTNLQHRTGTNKRVSSSVPIQTVNDMHWWQFTKDSITVTVAAFSILGVLSWQIGRWAITGWNESTRTPSTFHTYSELEYVSQGWFYLLQGGIATALVIAGLGAAGVIGAVIIMLLGRLIRRFFRRRTQQRLTNTNSAAEEQEITYWTNIFARTATAAWYICTAMLVLSTLFITIGLTADKSARQLGREFVTTKAQAATIDARLLLTLQGTTFVTSTIVTAEGISPLYRYSNVRVLESNGGQYVIYGAINPYTCAPLEVMILQPQDYYSVRLADGQALAPNCVPLASPTATTPTSVSTPTP